MCSSTSLAKRMGEMPKLSVSAASAARAQAAIPTSQSQLADAATLNAAYLGQTLTGPLPGLQIPMARFRPY